MEVVVLSNQRDEHYIFELLPNFLISMLVLGWNIRSFIFNMSHSFYLLRLFPNIYSGTQLEFRNHPKGDQKNKNHMFLLNATKVQQFFLMVGRTIQSVFDHSLGFQLSWSLDKCHVFPKICSKWHPRLWRHT